MLWYIVFCASVIWVVPCQNARLCDRMTPCDLIRFIRTHNKQISTVDEKTVRVNFLTSSLYRQGSDIRKNVGFLESSLEELTFKRNSRVEVDEDEFERVDHRGANEHLHQLMVVLRKWLVDVRTTLNNTLQEALTQNEEIQRLKKVAYESHQKVRALKNTLQNKQDAKWLETRKKYTVNGYEPSRDFVIKDTEIFINKCHTYQTETDGLHFASTELTNIKVSLANLVQLVNETENHCIHRISKVADRINDVQMKLNTLHETMVPVNK